VTRVYSEQSVSGVRAWCVASVASRRPFGVAQAGQGSRLWARAGGLARACAVPARGVTSSFSRPSTSSLGNSQKLRAAGSIAAASK
jgi:hypothetical protein